MVWAGLVIFHPAGSDRAVFVTFTTPPEAAAISGVHACGVLGEEAGTFIGDWSVVVDEIALRTIT